MKAMFNTPYKVLNHRKFNTWCWIKTRIDTYGLGCQHDCHYCYAKSLLNFRGNWNSSNPAMAYITEIENKISMLPRSVVVRMGSMTDCFQLLEIKNKVTYQAIQLLNKYKINYLIVTKSDLCVNDEYLKIYDKKLAHFQISMSTTNDSKCKEYENSPVTSKRISAAEKLYEHGFDVAIRLSPFMYEWVDFYKLNNIKCNKILIEFLKVNHWTRKYFNIDYSDYALRYGGHDNLTLDKKIELVKKIDGFEQVSIGEYVRDHYEYFKNNINYNKNDCCNINPTFFSEECEQVELFPRALQSERIAL